MHADICICVYTHRQVNIAATAVANEKPHVKVNAALGGIFLVAHLNIRYDVTAHGD